MQTKKGWPRAILQKFCRVLSACGNIVGLPVCVDWYRLWLVPSLRCWPVEWFPEPLPVENASGSSIYYRLQLLGPSIPIFCVYDPFVSFVVFCVLCFVFFFEKFCYWLPMHKGLREIHWAAGLGPQIQIQIVNEQNFKTYLFTMHRSPGTTMVPKRTSALAHWGRTMASSRQLPDTNRRRRAA